MATRVGASTPERWTGSAPGAGNPECRHEEAGRKYHTAIAQLPVAGAVAKGTLPITGVTKENRAPDAVKAAGIILTAEETAELERIADSLELDVIRFWEKEMK